MKIQMNQQLMEIPAANVTTFGYRCPTLEDIIRTEPHHLGGASLRTRYLPPEPISIVSKIPRSQQWHPETSIGLGDSRRC